MGKKTAQSGQAILEYVILLAVIVLVGAGIQFGIRKSRDKLWKTIICEVSAVCPACKATDSARNTLRSGGECAH